MRQVVVKKLQRDAIAEIEVQDADDFYRKIRDEHGNKIKLKEHADDDLVN